MKDVLGTLSHGSMDEDEVEEVYPSPESPPGDRVVQRLSAYDEWARPRSRSPTYSTIGFYDDYCDSWPSPSDDEKGAGQEPPRIDRTAAGEKIAASMRFIRDEIEQGTLPRPLLYQTERLLQRLYIEATHNEAARRQLRPFDAFHELIVGNLLSCGLALDDLVSLASTNRMIYAYLLPRIQSICPLLTVVRIRTWTPLLRLLGNVQRVDVVTTEEPYTQPQLPLILQSVRTCFPERQIEVCQIQDPPDPLGYVARVILCRPVLIDFKRQIVGRIMEKYHLPMLDVVRVTMGHLHNDCPEKMRRAIEFFRPHFNADVVCMAVCACMGTGELNRTRFFLHEAGQEAAAMFNPRWEDECPLVNACSAVMSSANYTACAMDVLRWYTDHFGAAVTQEGSSHAFEAICRYGINEKFRSVSRHLMEHFPPPDAQRIGTGLAFMINYAMVSPLDDYGVIVGHIQWFYDEYIRPEDDSKLDVQAYRIPFNPGIVKAHVHRLYYGAPLRLYARWKRNMRVVQLHLWLSGESHNLVWNDPPSRSVRRR